MRKSKKNSNRRSRRKTINRQRNKKSKKYYGGYVISVRDFFKDPWKYRWAGDDRLPNLIINEGVQYKEFKGLTKTTYIDAISKIPYKTTKQPEKKQLSTYGDGKGGLSSSTSFILVGSDTHKGIIEDNNLILIKKSGTFVEGISYKIDDSKMYIESKFDYDPLHEKLKREILEEIRHTSSNSISDRDLDEMRSSLLGTVESNLKKANPTKPK
jgi:hypothetical protein